VLGRVADTVEDGIVEVAVVVAGRGRLASLSIRCFKMAACARVVPTATTTSK